MQSPLLDARTARVGCLVLRLTMDLVHPGTLSSCCDLSYLADCTIFGVSSSALAFRLHGKLWFQDSTRRFFDDYYMYN